MILKEWLGRLVLAIYPDPKDQEEERTTGATQRIAQRSTRRREPLSKVFDEAMGLGAFGPRENGQERGTDGEDHE